MNTSCPCLQVEPDHCESAGSSQFSKATVLQKEDKIWNSMLKHTSTSQTQESRMCIPEPCAPVVTSRNKQDSCMTNVSKEAMCCKLPPNVDPEVFRLLPSHIQMELVTSFQHENSLQANIGPADPFPNPDRADHKSSASQNCETFSSPRSTTKLHFEAGKATESCGVPPVPQEPQLEDVPLNVDPYVFSQLPADVQRELLTEWRQQKPVLKIPSKQSHKNSKDKRTVAKSGQSNNIMKYFKPN